MNLSFGNDLGAARFGCSSPVTVQFVWAFLFFFWILINNLVYQTDFQINQLLFSSGSLFFSLALVSLHGRVSPNLLFFVFLAALFYLFSMLVSDSPEDFNRSVAYLVIILLYAFLFFLGWRIFVPRSLFYFYLVFYLALAVYIVYSGERAIVNPNWVAITLFYLYFIVFGRASIFFIVFGLILSFFVFESRGTSVVFLVAMLVFLSQKVFGTRLTKISYIFIYVSLVFCFFYIIHLLSIREDIIYQLIYSITDRGLGGRDTALVQGYQDLMSSNLLGLGPASPGGYENPETLKSVHIHFGLLELMLKFSALSLFLFFYLLYKLVRYSRDFELPMIGGALMAVFFYNGLAPSHLGINVLLIIMISKVIFGRRIDVNQRAIK